MANLPESLFEEPSSSVRRSRGGATNRLEIKSSHTHPDLTGFTIEQLILALNEDHTREQALQLLSQKRGMCDNLAILIWHSFGTVFILLKEIMQVYHLLSKPELTEKASTRVCNALALLQCVASNPETRAPFMKAKIPLYLYPFLNTTNKEKAHEYLRLTSLGVIGALVKVDDKEVISFLLKTEIVPYCLRCMEVGKGLTKTVATFIVQKILMNDEGFRYCCIIADRFFAITHALKTMTEQLDEEPPLASQRLLKHIVRCYLRLSESPRACRGLGKFLPQRLDDSNFINLLHNDPTAMGWLRQLFHNVYERRIRAVQDEHEDRRTH